VENDKKARILVPLYSVLSVKTSIFLFKYESEKEPENDKSSKSNSKKVAISQSNP
jgi:hypothetical protein